MRTPFSESSLDSARNHKPVSVGRRTANPPMRASGWRQQHPARPAGADSGAVSEDSHHAEGTPSSSTALVSTLVGLGCCRGLAGRALPSSSAVCSEGHGPAKRRDAVSAPGAHPSRRTSEEGQHRSLAAVVGSQWPAGVRASHIHSTSLPQVERSCATDAHERSLPRAPGGA